MIVDPKENKMADQSQPKRRKYHRKTNAVKNSNDVIRKVKIKKQKPRKRLADKPVESMHIFELNDHCLEEIFQYLSIDEMVCVAHTNKRFRKSVRTVFADKYATETIKVSNAHQQKSSKSLPSTYLIRYFGDSIKKLQVNYESEFNRFNQSLEAAIMKYCRKTLVDIELVNVDKYAFDRIKSPFKAVKTVCFTRCILGKFTKNLNKWFPNMTSLEFVEANIQDSDDAECIEKNFPKLEHLGIVNVIREDEGFDYNNADESEINALNIPDIFTNLNIFDCIERNPQLRSLKLKHNNDDLRYFNNEDSDGIKITSSFLAFVNEKLPQLERLDLTVLQRKFEDRGSNSAQLHFKALKQLKFEVEDTKTLKQFPISTSQLNELVVQSSVLDEQCCKFVERQKECKKLVVRGWWKSAELCEPMTKVIKGFSKLEQIEIQFNGLTKKQKDIIALLKNCKSLKSLVVLHDEKGFVEATNPEHHNRAMEIMIALGMFAPMLINAVNGHDADEDDEDDEEETDYDFEEVDESDYDESDHEEESDDDAETDDNDEGVDPKKINRKAFEEMFRSAFEAKCLGSAWQPKYTKRGYYYCAEYTKQE